VGGRRELRADNGMSPVRTRTCYFVASFVHSYERRRQEPGQNTGLEQLVLQHSKNIGTLAWRPGGVGSGLDLELWEPLAVS
jgi:hypothetical protein